MNDNVTTESQQGTPKASGTETVQPTHKIKMLPTTRQRRERLIRATLGVLAVVLLITGFATPQIVQAVEFQSRGEFVDELSARYTTLERHTQRNDAVTILTGLKLHQMNRLDTAIQEVLEVDENPLTSEQRSQLTRASDLLNDARQSMDMYLSFPLLSGATEIVQDHRQSGPSDTNVEFFQGSAASWPTDDIDYALDIFNVAPLIHRDLPSDHSKMTNAQFSDVKKDLEDTEAAIKKQEAREQSINADLSELEAIVAEALGLVETVAPEVITSADELFGRAAEFEFDTVPLEGAVADITQAVAGGPFMLDSNGTLRVAPDSLPEGARAIDGVSNLNRGVVIAQSLKVFLTQFNTVDAEVTELEEIREAEILAQEEYERQLAYEEELRRQQQDQEQTPTPPPATEDPGPGEEEPPEQGPENPEEPTDPDPGTEDPAPNPEP